MLATLSQRRAIWTLQGPTEVLVRFDGATTGGALRRDGQSRRYDAGGRDDAYLSGHLAGEVVASQPEACVPGVLVWTARRDTQLGCARRCKSSSSPHPAPGVIALVTRLRCVAGPSSAPDGLAGRREVGLSAGVCGAPFDHPRPGHRVLLQRWRRGDRTLRIGTRRRRAGTYGRARRTRRGWAARAR
jgi:hypothetical protein